MIDRFLGIIQAGEGRSLSEISHMMGISRDMILKIVNELTNKGYLQEVSADCEKPHNECSKCPAKNACQANIKQWFVTEKGRTAISRASILKSF